jgi:hypothetical protein
MVEAKAKDLALARLRDQMLALFGFRDGCLAASC